MSKIITKIKGIKKRYYVIFGLLVLFFIYNTITLRGFFYTENCPVMFFGFMDSWHGYTDVPNRSFKNEYDEGTGYVSAPSDIHDIENSNEWYGSIFGTVVFMKWKWIGLHVGDYMVLIDTWVPRSYAYDNHIFGHPYYSLYKYDSVNNYPTNDEKRDKLSQRMVDEAKSIDSDLSKNGRHWENNYQKYRISTVIFYCIILVGIIVVIRLLILHRRHR